MNLCRKLTFDAIKYGMIKIFTHHHATSFNCLNFTINVIRGAKPLTYSNYQFNVTYYNKINVTFRLYSRKERANSEVYKTKDRQDPDEETGLLAHTGAS